MKPFFTAAAVASEVAMALSATGAWPPAAWKLLMLPAWAGHLAFMRLRVPGDFLVYAGLFVASGAALDLLRWRLVTRRRART